MKSPLLLLLSFLAFSAAAQPAPGPMIPREGAFVFGPATALAATKRSCRWPIMRPNTWGVPSGSR